MTTPGKAHRNITVLGSTGSVGESTLDLIARSRADQSAEQFSIEALTAHRNVDRLAEQAVELGARLAVIADPDLYSDLKQKLSGSGVEAAAGETALIDAAARPVDWTMAAIVGAAGLRPTLAAVDGGQSVALANKECLVSAGHLFMDRVRATGATLLPVDSEHNAIFQVFDLKQKHSIRRIVLTASGGPFRQSTYEEMAAMTPKQALAHPNWSMGPKISIDSATMMNKGLEVVEALHLFELEPDQVEVLIHPQSVVHGMVEYADGSVLAQMGSPDMRTPIASALAWPNRMEAPCERLDLAKLSKLTFEEPDTRRFPALRLVRDTFAAGDGAMTALNAANEVAVHSFLSNSLGFLDICAVVEQIVETYMAQNGSEPFETLEEVFATDVWARNEARVKVQKLAA